MTGSHRIEAPRDLVWAALNDPDVLTQCIPGCEALEKLSATEMTAKVRLKIGPVKATFSGRVTLSDIEQPAGWTIKGEGTGIAGHAKGGATVRLDADGGATVLTYVVKAQIGGKLAQIGARLIDATARKLAAEFFARFAALVSAMSSSSMCEPELEIRL